MSKAELIRIAVTEFLRNATENGEIVHHISLAEAPLKPSEPSVEPSQELAQKPVKYSAGKKSQKQAQGQRPTEPGPPPTQK